MGETQQDIRNPYQTYVRIFKLVYSSCCNTSESCIVKLHGIKNILKINILK